MNAVVERMEREPAPPAAVTPMDLISRAVEQGASIEMVQQLWALKKEMDAYEARKAFAEAFSAFKAEAVKVVRNREVADGPLRGKKYAELYSVIDAVTPALSRHGLSASWAITRDERDWIEVTCTIEHVLGHTRTVSQGGPPDAGGAKNAIQARVSTVTYLERHTLKAACGIAESGDDDDGRSAGAGGTITEDQAKQIEDLLTDVKGNRDVFLKYFKVGSVGAIPATDFDRAVAALEKKRGAK